MPFIMKQVNIELEQISTIESLPVPFSVFCRNALYDYALGQYDPQKQDKLNLKQMFVRAMNAYHQSHNYHIDEEQCENCKALTKIYQELQEEFIKGV